MRPMIIIAAAVAIAGAGIGTFVIAEEPRPAVGTDASAGDGAQPVRPGEYRDLNWYRWVKLGAAPYVNPTQVKQMAVAYKYDPKDMVATADSEAWMAAIQGGVLKVATVEDGVYVVKGFGFEQELWPLAEEPQAKSWGDILTALKAQAGDFAFISTDGMVHGARPVGKVVSWNATDWSAGTNGGNDNPSGTGVKEGSDPR